jgi:hypothetical protein
MWYKFSQENNYSQQMTDRYYSLLNQLKSKYNNSSEMERIFKISWDLASKKNNPNNFKTMNDFEKVFIPVLNQEFKNQYEKSYADAQNPGSQLYGDKSFSTPPKDFKLFSTGTTPPPQGSASNLNQNNAHVSGPPTHNYYYPQFDPRIKPYFDEFKGMDAIGRYMQQHIPQIPAKPAK